MAGSSDSNSTSIRDNSLVELVGPDGTPTGIYLDRTKVDSSIAGLDVLSNERRVQTKVRSDGLTALCTDASVIVESTFGITDRPFSFFTVIKTGAENDTITLSIAASTADTTSPLANAAAYTKVFTTVAGEVGDEEKLSRRMVSELNLDSNFRTAAYLKAIRPTDRNTVYIRSDKYSQSGEYWERATAGDFDVTVTGTAQVVIGYDNLVARAIPVVINPDTDSPHRVGRFGISGAVSVVQQSLSDLFTDNAKLSGSPDLRVDGSVTPKVFTIPAQSFQLFIEGMFFHAQANSIQYGKFVGLNAALTNGVVVSIKSDNIVTTFPTIKTTEDFKNGFAALSLDGSNFNLDPQAGRDEMLAILRFPNPFLIRETGVFGAGNDDYIKVIINDNIPTNSIYEFEMHVKGFRKEP